MNQPNPHLTDLLRRISFYNHSLNDMLDLAHRAGYDTRGLERLISATERETRRIRMALRQQAEAPAPAAAAEPCPERWADN